MHWQCIIAILKVCRALYHCYYFFRKLSGLVSHSQWHWKHQHCNSQITKKREAKTKHSWLTGQGVPFYALHQDPCQKWYTACDSLQQAGTRLPLSKSGSASVLSHSGILQGCESALNVFNFYFYVAGTVNLAGEKEWELPWIKCGVARDVAPPFPKHIGSDLFACLRVLPLHGLFPNFTIPINFRIFLKQKV